MHETILKIWNVFYCSAWRRFSGEAEGGGADIDDDDDEGVSH